MVEPTSRLRYLATTCKYEKTSAKLLHANSASGIVGLRFRAHPTRPQIHSIVKIGYPWRFMVLLNRVIGHHIGTPFKGPSIY